MAPSGGWAALRALGAEADDLTKDVKADASYSKKQESLLESRIEPLLAKVPADAGGFAPGSSIAPDPCRIGWGEIGRVFAVKTQEAVEQRDYDAAVKLAVDGTRFAFLVASGDASDSLVGFPIADSIRRVLAPSLREMSDKQLGALADGIEADLKLLPPSSESAAHEALSMRTSIQALQNAYQMQQLDAVQGELGDLSRDPLNDLKGYRGGAESKRAAFFEALGEVEGTEAAWLTDAVATPAAKRADDPLLQLKLTSKKPWIGIARVLFLTGGPMLDVRDRTLARTHLLILTSRIVGAVKHGGAVPTDLSGFDPTIDADPYTGGRLLYTPKGARDFSLYSAGADGIDNGGETDDAGVAPDLFLEGST